MSLIFFLAFPGFASAHVVSFLTLTPFFVFTSVFALRYVEAALQERRWIYNAILFVLICGFFSHALLLIARRHTQQMGYPVAYPTSIAMAQNSDYNDRILTSFEINNLYYRFYADRYVVMGVDDIERFDEEMDGSGDGFDLFMAVDGERFFETFPALAPSGSDVSDLNGFGIDGPLFDMLNESCPSYRSGYLVIYDLSGITRDIGCAVDE
jgi:hypothetical protein